MAMYRAANGCREWAESIKCAVEYHMAAAQFIIRSEESIKCRKCVRVRIEWVCRFHKHCSPSDRVNSVFTLNGEQRNASRVRRRQYFVSVQVNNAENSPYNRAKFSTGIYGDCLHTVSCLDGKCDVLYLYWTIEWCSVTRARGYADRQRGRERKCYRPTIFQSVQPNYVFQIFGNKKCIKSAIGGMEITWNRRH